MTEPMLSVHLCTIDVLVLSALNKHGELGKEAAWHPQDSDFIPLITNNVQRSGTFCFAFTWDPMRANSERFIYITHSPISNLFSVNISTHLAKPSVTSYESL